MNDRRYPIKVWIPSKLRNTFVREHPYKFSTMWFLIRCMKVCRCVIARLKLRFMHERGKSIHSYIFINMIIWVNLKYDIMYKNTFVEHIYLWKIIFPGTRIAFLQERQGLLHFSGLASFFPNATRDARAVARLDTRSARTLGSLPGYGWCWV